MHSEIEKLVITLLVMRSFSVLLGAPRACLDFREPTAVFRVIPSPCREKVTTPGKEEVERSRKPEPRMRVIRIKALGLPFTRKKWLDILP